MIKHKAGKMKELYRVIVAVIMIGSFLPSIFYINAVGAEESISGNRTRSSQLRPSSTVRETKRHTVEGLTEDMSTQEERNFDIIMDDIRPRLSPDFTNEDLLQRVNRDSQNTITTSPALTGRQFGDWIILEVGSANLSRLSQHIVVGKKLLFFKSLGEMREVTITAVRGNVVDSRSVSIDYIHGVATGATPEDMPATSENGIFTVSCVISSWTHKDSCGLTYSVLSIEPAEGEALVFKKEHIRISRLEQADRVLSRLIFEKVEGTQMARSLSKIQLPLIKYADPREHFYQRRYEAEEAKSHMEGWNGYGLPHLLIGWEWDYTDSIATKGKGFTSYTTHRTRTGRFYFLITEYGEIIFFAAEDTINGGTNIGDLPKLTVDEVLCREKLGNLKNKAELERFFKRSILTAIEYTARHRHKENDDGTIDLRNLWIQNPARYGSKGSGFSLFNRYGLRCYPEGFVITSDIVTEIKSTREISPQIEERIKQLLERNDKFLQYDDSKGMVSVRSSPEESMPGILDTILYIGAKGALQDRYEQVKSAILAVIDSWDKPRAKRYLKSHPGLEKKSLAVLIQRMAFSEHNRDTGSGVCFTMDPDTSEDRLAGSFLEGSAGSELVSMRRQGRPIDELKYGLDELDSAKKTLDYYEGLPFELEFAFESIRLYWLQIRPLKMSPSLLNNILEANKEKLAFVRLQLLELMIFQEAMRSRVGIIRQAVMDKKEVKPILRAPQSLPGAIKGRLALSKEKALEWLERGESVIAVLSNQDEDALYELCQYENVGWITTYGDVTAHAAVVGRSLGIPALISVKEPINIKEGREVVLDGDRKALYPADESVSVVETKLMTNSITDMRHQIQSTYLKSGEAEPAAVFQNLLQANVEVLNRFQQYRIDRESASQDSALSEFYLRKILLQELLIEVGKKQGLTAIDTMELLASEFTRHVPFTYVTLIEPAADSAGHLNNMNITELINQSA